MEYADVTKGDTLTNKVQINFDMLRSLMLNGICRKVEGTDVVAKNNGGLAKRSVKLGEELAEPTRLGHGIGDDAILCFRTGAGHRLLSLGGP